eukprot:120619-Prymnesium_polylepis.1
MQEAQEAARLAFDDLQRAVMSVPATLSIKELTEAVKVTHREITRRRSSVSYSAESPTEARFRIELANVYGPPTYVNVTVDFEGQHTIKWSRHVRVVHASGICEHGVRARRLRPGKCNLYTYPAITYEVTAAMCLSCRPTPLSALCIRQPARPLYHRVTNATCPGEHNRHADAAQPHSPQPVCKLKHFLPLCPLTPWNVLAPGTAQHEDDVEFCELRDSSGATPTLGLLVANSEEATEVALEFYRNVPVTLLQQHSVGSPFAGEMAMHVLAVNQREDTLMAVIRLAHQNFDESQLRILYTTTAHGAFFSAEPMIFYGGTVLSYLVAFGAPAL